MVRGALPSCALGLLAVSQAVRLAKRRAQDESGNTGESHSLRSDLIKSSDCLKGSTARTWPTTGWDAHWKFEARDNHSIGRVQAYHDNKKEDRRFTFEEVFVSPNAYLDTSVSYWSGWLNNWDAEVKYVCNHDHVITGIESYHDNGKEDRRWNVRCSKVWTGDYVGAVRERQHTNTGWVNNWDASFDAHLPYGSLMAGIHSIHDNGKEDRRFCFDYKQFCMVFN